MKDEEIMVKSGGKIPFGLVEACMDPDVMVDTEIALPDDSTAQEYYDLYCRKYEARYGEAPAL